MARFRIPLPGDELGSALVEFAVSLPLLVVFVVGIFDFSGAFNQKQKMEQAAQEGAIVAAAQQMTDITTTGNGSPDSLQPVAAAVFNSLAASRVLPLANQGTCQAASNTVTQTGPLEWTIVVSGCPDVLNVTINRGWVPPVTDTTKTVGTLLTVIYPYHWRFNSVIQLLGGSYQAKTYLIETAKVHNQT
jgi:Flp pilus assembly protein TadG